MVLVHSDKSHDDHHQEIVYLREHSTLTKQMILSLIVAMDRNNGIGVQNRLPWHLPADLRHFKTVTSGHTVIMGRKTYESIGKALPNRRNVVVSRSADYQAEGCEVLNNLQAALDVCKDEAEVFVIGGSEIYGQAFPLADKLYITLVDTVTDADTFFPPFNENEWELLHLEEHQADPKNQFDYSFCIYQRKS